MFIGHFQHTLDEKGRLMIPSRFRDLLAGNGAFITQGFEKCLMVMTEPYFQKVYEQIEAMNLTDPTARLLRRLILANAYPVETDKIGRIVVPQTLRAFLQAEGEATVVGQGQYFEVWKPADWKLEMDKMYDIETNQVRFATLQLSNKNTAS
jgi:MraZ protein